MNARAPHAKLESVLVGVAALVLYAATGARDVVWGDPTKLTLLVHEGRFSLAQWSHAGSLLWSWPFTLLPIDPYALRVHLGSAAASGVAFGFLHATLARCGLARWPARVALAAVALAHTVWFVSAMTESYPIALAALCAAWYFLVRGRPLLGGVVVGLGSLAHLIALFSVPALLWALWRSSAGVRGAARAAVGIALGCALPGAAILLGGSASRGLDDLNFWAVVEPYASPELPAKNVPLLGAYLVYNFVGPALWLLFVGLRALGRRERVTALVLCACHYVVALFWIPQRAYLIPVPLYVAAAWPLALGVARILERRPRALAPLFFGVVACPVAAYAVAPALYGAFGLPELVRDAPFRDERRFFMQPWKVGDDSARRYVTALEEALPEGALVVGDFTTLQPLYYAQLVEGWRPDLQVLTIDNKAAALVRETVSQALAREKPVRFLDREALVRPDGVAALGDVHSVPSVEGLLALERP